MPAFCTFEAEGKIGFDVIAVHVNHGLRGESAKETNGLRKHFAGSGIFPVLCIMRM